MLESITDLKIKEFQGFYDTENEQRNLEEEFLKVNEMVPEYVDFNQEPLPYDEALLMAKSEVFKMFKDCKNFDEAVKKLKSNENCCTEERGYCVSENTSGNYYGEMAMIYADLLETTIYWTVRWH